MSENKDYLNVVCSCAMAPPRTIPVKKNIIKTIIAMNHHGPIPLLLAGLDVGGGLVGTIEPLDRTIVLKFPQGSLAWRFLDDVYLSMEVNSDNQILFILREKQTKD